MATGVHDSSQSRHLQLTWQAQSYEATHKNSNHHAQRELQCSEQVLNEPSTSQTQLAQLKRTWNRP